MKKKYEKSTKNTQVDIPHHFLWWGFRRFLFLLGEKDTCCFCCSSSGLESGRVGERQESGNRTDKLPAWVVPEENALLPREQVEGEGRTGIWVWITDRSWEIRYSVVGGTWFQQGSWWLWLVPRDLPVCWHEGWPWMHLDLSQALLPGFADSSQHWWAFGEFKVSVQGVLGAASARRHKLLRGKLMAGEWAVCVCVGGGRQVI